MRTLILFLGPPVLVGLSYWLAGDSLQEGRHPESSTGRKQQSTDRAGADDGAAMEAACRAAARNLRARLDDRFRTVVRPPYVLAADFGSEQLQHCYRSVVLPIQRALRTSYFDHEPDEPIVVVLCTTERRYWQCARRLDDRSPDSEYGYYHRDERRIVANIATGYGTLAHELTHALAHFDFPEMPEWFDEGLAALHEQSAFTEDGLRLEGLSNWRLNVLLQALEQGRLESIASFVAKPALQRGQKAVDYAYARYLCLYLQKHGLLEPFYRKFRFAVRHDPTGHETLSRLLQVKSLAEIDRDFRRWVRSLN